MTYYPANAKPAELTPADGKRLSLDEARQLVGGWVQSINLGNSWIMLVNEEGKVLKMPYNPTATKILREVYDTEDYIVGNAVVCKRNEF